MERRGANPSPNGEGLAAGRWVAHTPPPLIPAKRELIAALRRALGPPPPNLAYAARTLGISEAQSWVAFWGCGEGRATSMRRL